MVRLGRQVPLEQLGLQEPVLQGQLAPKDQLVQLLDRQLVLLVLVAQLVRQLVVHLDLLEPDCYLLVAYITLLFILVNTTKQ